MKNNIYYFAYGSNMNSKRMQKRCPGAKDLGVARLENYSLQERLYADIDYDEGSQVLGVLYSITLENLKALDLAEGYPAIYKRYWVNVELNGETFIALVYEMTEITKLNRDGKPYPEDYRKICADGAKEHKIQSKFRKMRTKKIFNFNNIIDPKKYNITYYRRTK